ncbi:MAG: class I SAM-dependent methyltransferase [Hyphomicrobiaceae bacterium]
MAADVKGTQGYAEAAALLLARYEAVSFEEVHGQVMHLIPQSPSIILDVGAGSGRDAAFLAGAGHRVVAVEPTDELRIPASQLHPSPSIEWIDDALPELSRIIHRSAEFDVIMVTAVWVHLDACERRRAMPALAHLLKPSGIMILTIRHGPAPAGRRTFAVSASETVVCAADAGLDMILNVVSPSAGALNRAAGVTWTRLAFARSASGSTAGDGRDQRA